jgi:hypothetical protein
VEKVNSRLTRLKIKYTNSICDNRNEDDKVYLLVDKLLKETSEYYTDILNRVDTNWKDKINWDDGGLTEVFTNWHNKNA